MDKHPAPAMDAAGNEVWNVWLSKPNVPEFVVTTYSYLECIMVCDTFSQAGFTVLTDAI